MASGISIGKMFVEFGADFSDLSKDIAKIQGVFEGLEGKFTKAGTALSLAITAPLAGIGAVALNAFGDFEASLNKVSALQNIFGADMEKLKKQALDLGAVTQFSAKQAADAMGEFAAQGFNATQIYEAMPGALNLAAAGQLKVADAANISAAILKGFNLETSKINDVANVLAKAAGESAVSVQDLGFSFKYVGPVASAAGVSFTETAAALAALGNAGIKGEMGGTAIRNMISDLLKPSKQAAETLKELGINVLDASGKMLPLGQVIDRLSPLTNNLTAGFQVFGVRFSEVLPLLKLGQKGFDELNEKMIKASEGRGAATEMAENLFKGWNAAVETFKGSIETTLIKIGDILAKPAGVIFVKILTPLLNGIGDLAEMFGKLPMPVQAVGLALGGIAVAAGPAILAIGGLMRAVTDLKGLPEVVNAVGEKFFYGGLKIQEFGETAAKAIKAFVAEFSAANLMKAGNDFRASLANFASSAIDTLKNLPANTKAAVAGFAASIGTELATHSNTIKTGFMKMFDAIKGVDIGALLGGIGPKIATAVTGIMSAISGLSVAGVWSSVVAGFSSIATAISGFVAAASAVAAPVALVVAAVAALAAVGYEVYKNWDYLTDVFGAFWRDIQNIVSSAAQKVGTWIDNALGGGTTARIAAVWQSFAGFFGNLWNNIIGMIDKATRFIVDQAQRAAFALGMNETAASLAKWRDALDKAAAGIKNVADTATTAGKQMAMAFNFTGVDDAKKKLGELNDIVKLTIQQVQTDITFKGLKNSMSDVSALKTVLTQLNGAYEGVVKLQKEGKISDKEAADMKAALARQVQEVKGQISQFANAVPAATTAVETHAKKIKDTAHIYKEWKDKVQDVLEDMAKTFESFSTRVSNGMNWNKDVAKLEEMLRDMGRAMEGLRTPAEKLKLALKMDEVAKAANQYREWGAALRDADIPKQMDAITRASNEMRSKKALDFAFSGLTEIQKETKKVEEYFRTLGIEAGQVYEKLQGKDVRLQALEKAQEAYDYITKRAKEFNVSQEDLEKATVTLAKARADYYFGELGGIDGVTKAFQALGQQPPLDFTIKTDQAQKAVEELHKQFEIMKASGLATPQQLSDAWLSYLEKKLDAERKANANVKIETAGLFGFIGAKAEESAAATQIAFIKGMRNLKEQLSKDFGNLFSSLFEGNFGKALDSLKDLGNNAWKNLKATFLNPFEKAFKDTFSSIGDGISDFVTKNLVGTLMQGFNKITGGILNFGGAFSSTISSATKTAQNFSGVLGTAADNLTKSANSLSKAADSLSTAAGLGGQAANAAGTAAQASTTAAAGVGNTIAKSITGALTNWVAPISAAVSAVTDVIALFGQRRMEKDIGRIEVTTREIFSQLLSIQGDVNKYWPNLLNLTELMRLGFMENVAVESKQILEEIAGHIKDVLEALRDGIATLPEGGGGDGESSREARTTDGTRNRGAAPTSPSTETDDAMEAGAEAVEGLTQNVRTFTVTVQEAVDPVTQASKAFEAVPKAASDAGKEMEAAAAATTKTAEAVKIQRGVFNDQQQAVVGSTVAIDENRAVLSNYTREVDESRGRLGRLTNAQEDATTASGTLGRAVEDLAQPMENVAEVVTETVALMDASAQHYEDKLNGVGREMQASADIMDQAQAAMEAMGIRLNGTAEENRQQYYRMYMDMYGFSDQLKQVADRVDPFAADIENGFLHVTDALGNATARITYAAQEFGGVAGSAMAQTGNVFVQASDSIYGGTQALTGSLGYLGSQVAGAASAAVAQIAGAAARVESAVPAFTPAGVPAPYTPATGGTAGSAARGGAPTPEVPRVPPQNQFKPPEIPKPKGEEGELTPQEFAAKGYKYGRQTATGNIVPIGPPAETAPAPSSAPPATPAETTGNSNPAVTALQNQMAEVSKAMMASVSNVEKTAALSKMLNDLGTELGVLMAAGAPKATEADAKARAAQLDADAAKRAQAGEVDADAKARAAQLAADASRRAEIPRVSAPAPPVTTLPASAYNSSPAADEVGGGNVYNIYVDVESADENKIAQAIVDKIRRNTGR